MSKVIVSLEGQGGLLDKQEVEFVPGDDSDEALSIAAQSVIETWTLSAGDTIKIREPGREEE